MKAYLMRLLENSSKAIDLSGYTGTMTLGGTYVFTGTLNLSGASVTGLGLTASAVNPDSDDGAALGTTALKWSDIFLASGAVINFNSGDVTLTHSANNLAFAGGNISMDGLLTLSANAALNFTGTAITKGINFAGAVAAMTDADDAFISCGTWNDAVVVGTQQAHFVPIQVHLHSNVSAAYDIAAARFRVDTSAANTLNALGCLQLRQQIGHDVASSAILNASVNVSGAVAVQTGSLLGGYFSIEGSGAITKAGDNDCTPLVAVSNHTGGGVDNVFVACMNGTGDTIDEIIKVVVTNGYATTGIALAGTMTYGIDFTNIVTPADAGNYGCTLNSGWLAIDPGSGGSFGAKLMFSNTDTSGYVLYGLGLRCRSYAASAKAVGLNVSASAAVASSGQVIGGQFYLQNSGSYTIVGGSGYPSTALYCKSWLAADCDKASALWIDDESSTKATTQYMVDITMNGSVEIDKVFHIYGGDPGADTFIDFDTCDQGAGAFVTATASGGATRSHRIKCTVNGSTVGYMSLYTD